MVNKYSETVKSVIEDFVKNDWQNKCFDYISESDVRSCLYVKLINGFSKEKMQLKVQKSGGQDPFDDQTILVHCEMAIPVNHRKHLDIGIWSKNVPVKVVDYKDFPVCVGIEIKYYWVNKLYAGVVNGIVEDVKKILEVSNQYMKKSFKGYVLVFLPRILKVSNAKTEMKEKIGKIMKNRKSEFGNGIEIYPIFAQNNDFCPLPLFK